MNKLTTIPITLARLLATLSLCVLFLVYGSASTTVHAQANTSEEELGLAVRPAILEIVANQSESASTAITLENTTANAMKVQILARTLIPIDNAVDQDRRSEFDASAWLRFEESELSIDVGEVVTFDATVTVPRHANPGNHYAMTIVRIVSGGLGASGSGTTVLPEVGISVFVNVPGEINENLEFVDSNIGPARIDKDSQATFSFELKNTGNVHILPSPKIIVRNDDGTIETIALQPQLILPNTQKMFEFNWLADVPYGNYEVQAEITYGTASIPLAITGTFKVWPPTWQIATAITGGIALLVFFVGRRNIPRAIAVLRGKSRAVKGTFKSDESTDPQSSDDYDYHQIVEDLKHEMPIVGLPADPQPAPHLFESDSATTETDSTDETEMPVEEIVDDAEYESLSASKEPPTSIDEIIADDGDSKTVITQTNATTIIREESYFQPPTDAEKAVTKIAVQSEKSTTKPKTKPKNKTKSSTKSPAKIKNNSKTKKSASKQTKKRATKPATKLASSQKKTITKKSINSRTATSKQPSAKKNAAKTASNAKTKETATTRKKTIKKKTAAKRQKTKAKKTTRPRSQANKKSLPKQSAKKK